MRRKEGLYAVIGGVVGAVLTMAAGLVLPLGAQNGATDAEFGEITCRKIRVVNERGEQRGYWGYLMGGSELRLFSTDGGGSGLVASKYVGNSVYVQSKKGRAVMEIDEHGGRVRVDDLNDKDQRAIAWMGIREHGGIVGVDGKGETRGVMFVDKNGNGVVSTWDKKGNHLATLE